MTGETDALRYRLGHLPSERCGEPRRSISKTIVWLQNQVLVLLVLFHSISNGRESTGRPRKASPRRKARQRVSNAQIFVYYDVSSAHQSALLWTQKPCLAVLAISQPVRGPKPMHSSKPLVHWFIDSKLAIKTCFLSKERHYSALVYLLPNMG